MEVKIDGEEKTYYGPVAQDVFNVPNPKMDHSIIKWLGPNDSDEYFNVQKRYPDYFDYGYCLSVHKSQGSEWRRVMVIEEPCQYWKGADWNRWIYTAVTRSSEQLLIVR
jgi:ATP-dependent exoDNAse (exonuclease V) alpha subunit